MDVGFAYHRMSDEAMLEGLRGLLEEKGALSIALIDAAPALPCSRSYSSRFGSLLTAYELVGFKPKPRYRKASAAQRKSRDVRKRIAASLGTPPKRPGQL